MHFKEPLLQPLQCMFARARCHCGSLSQNRPTGRTLALRCMSQMREQGSLHNQLVLVVAACLIDGRGRVLLSQRPEGKQMAGGWEFPGGKARCRLC